jgi:hypothetical protein
MKRPHVEWLKLTGFHRFVTQPPRACEEPILFSVAGGEIGSIARHTPPGSSLGGVPVSRAGAPAKM